jgi:hypothetical protein
MESKEYQAAYYKKNRDVLRARQNATAKQRRASLKPIVYRWLNPDGITVDYVGRGTIERAKDKKKKEWLTKEHTLIYEECLNEWHAMEMEGKWGQLYAPRYNKDGYRK